MTTTKELLVTLNELRASNGKDPLAQWKASRAKLEQAIEDEQVKALADETSEAEQVEPTDEMDLIRMDSEGPISVTSDDVPTAPIDPKVDAPKPPRGGIMAMSIQLLTETAMPYDEIVEEIKKAFPQARTTTRSLASVAMDLRKDNIEVPSRRKVAKPKEVAPDQLIKSIKEWAMANYDTSFGASALLETKTDQELTSEFKTLAQAQEWASLQDEAMANASE